MNDPNPLGKNAWSTLAIGAIRSERPGWRDALLRRLLAVADVLAVALATITLFFDGYEHSSIFWFLLCLPLWVVVAKLQGLYHGEQRSLRHLTIDELPKLVIWVVIVTIGLAIVFLAADGSRLRLSSASIFAGVALVAVFALRVVARWFWRAATPPERTIVFGEGRSIVDVRRKLDLFSDIHVSVVEQRPTLDPEDLADADWSGSFDRVIAALAQPDEELVERLVEVCRRDELKLSLIPPGRGMFSSAVQLNHIADLPVLEYHTAAVARSTLFLKRAFDIAVCVLVLPLFLLFFGLIALAIKLDSRGPIIFRQTRAGLDGRPFRLFKFRTMVPDADRLLANLINIDELEEPAWKLVDDPRVTRVGKVLRRWSLDELPQLLNVLRGDMSLVGPRPEQVELVDRYESEHRFRLSVKPGLTGPMQVFGRGSLSFQERLAVEREYVDNLSFRRDFRLLALTVAAVLGGQGAV